MSVVSFCEIETELFGGERVQSLCDALSSAMSQVKFVSFPAVARFKADDQTRAPEWIPEENLIGSQ